MRVMMVRVIIVDLKTGRTVEDTKIDWNRRKSREWLNHKQTWCFENGQGVQLMNLYDKEPGK